MQNAGVLRNTIILQQKLFCDGPLPITIAYFVDTAIVALVPRSSRGGPWNSQKGAINSLQSLHKNLTLPKWSGDWWKMST